jgi:hypothetical protein
VDLTLLGGLEELRVTSLHTHTRHTSRANGCR